jgi:hypothetical protein
MPLRPSPADGIVLSRIGVTDHAIERFAARAGLLTAERQVVEPIMRELLLREGRVVTQRPPWARSRNTADLYLQLGDWMLLIGCRDEHRPGGYAIVTAVNGPREGSWMRALRRGNISTPPPMVPRAPRRVASLLRAIRERRHGESLSTAFRRVDRRRQAQYRATCQVVIRRWRGSCPA